MLGLLFLYQQWEYVSGLSLPGPGISQCPLISIWVREISLYLLFGTASNCVLQIQLRVWQHAACVLPLVQTSWLVSLLKAVTSNSRVVLRCGMFSLYWCSPQFLLEGKWILDWSVRNWLVLNHRNKENLVRKLLPYLYQPAFPYFHCMQPFLCFWHLGNTQILLLFFFFRTSGFGSDQKLIQFEKSLSMLSAGFGLSVSLVPLSEIRRYTSNMLRKLISGKRKSNYFSVAPECSAWNRSVTGLLIPKTEITKEEFSPGYIMISNIFY